MNQKMTLSTPNNTEMTLVGREVARRFAPGWKSGVGVAHPDQSQFLLQLAPPTDQNQCHHVEVNQIPDDAKPGFSKLIVDRCMSKAMKTGRHGFLCAQHYRET